MVASYDKLDAQLTYTTMSAAEKTAITNAVSAIAATDTLGRTRMAAYLFAVSPRYQVNR